MEAESAYVELVVCPRHDEPVVEFMDHHGLVRVFTRADFCEEFADCYDDGDLQALLATMELGTCSCCKWGSA